MTYSRFRSIPRFVSVSVELCTLLCPLLVSAQGTLVAPFGSNKELSPAHQSYQFPYKENYIMLPLTNSTVVNNGEVRVIVNKPVVINNRRTTVIPLNNGGPTVSPEPVVPMGMNGGNVARPTRSSGHVISRTYYTHASEIGYATETATANIANATSAATPVPSTNSVLTPSRTEETPSVTTFSTPTDLYTPESDSHTEVLAPPAPETPPVSEIQSEPNRLPMESAPLETPPVEEPISPYIPQPEPENAYSNDSHSSSDSYYDNTESYEKSYNSAPTTPPQSAWRSENSASTTDDWTGRTDETFNSSPMIMTRPETRTSNSRRDIEIQKPTLDNASPTHKTPAFSSTQMQEEINASTYNSRPAQPADHDIVIVRPRRSKPSLRPISPENRDNSAHSLPAHPEPQPKRRPVAPSEELPTQLPTPESLDSPMGPKNNDGTKV